MNDPHDYYRRRDKRHDEALDVFIDCSLALAALWLLLRFFGWV